MLRLFLFVVVVVGCGDVGGSGGLDDVVVGVVTIVVDVVVRVDAFVVRFGVIVLVTVDFVVTSYYH